MFKKWQLHTSYLERREIIKLLVTKSDDEIEPIKNFILCSCQIAYADVKDVDMIFSHLLKVCSRYADIKERYQISKTEQKFKLSFQNSTQNQI